MIVPLTAFLKKDRYSVFPLMGMKNIHVLIILLFIPIIIEIYMFLDGNKIKWSLK